LIAAAPPALHLWFDPKGAALRIRVDSFGVLVRAVRAGVPETGRRATSLQHP
jgi:hypothetical protein